MTQLVAYASSGRRLVRHLAVASVSLLLVVSAAGYVFASTTEALAAILSSVSSRQGHESIEGRVQGSPTGLVTIQVIAQRNGKRSVLRTVKVARNGHFHVPVTPGSYTLVIADGTKRMSRSVTVKSGGAEFVVVEVTRHSEGSGLVPVIFNY